MAWFVPPLNATEMVTVQMVLHAASDWMFAASLLYDGCPGGRVSSFKQGHMVSVAAAAWQWPTVLWEAPSLCVTEWDSQNTSLLVFVKCNPLLFPLKWIPSIFNRVCWKLVNQENWMRSLRNICARHNCIKSNNQWRHYSTRGFKRGVERRLCIFPM